MRPPLGFVSPPQASPLAASLPAARRRVPVGPTLDIGAEHLARHLITELLDASLVLVEDWQKLSSAVQEEIGGSRTMDQLLPKLVEHRLLTRHQAERIRAGTTYGLVLGNYRVLERIGAGGMGVVFKGEHILMRRHVAIKVLPLSRDHDPRLLLRFIAEIRSVAALQHPNIVSAMDAGQLTPSDPNSPVLHYLVMEYVPGQDLEQLVMADGPLEPIRACDVIHQIACALAEANHHQMVHRDLKPSNILVTPEDQAKLLDFGLAHDFRNQALTEAGSLLGTLEYMAPEQAQDARSVDIRADIYGLGGTLFWALTGKLPFPRKGMLIEELARRVNSPAPSIRDHRPELPAELDAVVARMMAPKPADRYPTPQHVMRGLMPFLKSDRHDVGGGVRPAQIDHGSSGSGSGHSPRGGPSQKVCRVLVIDDDATIRQICRFALQSDTLQCEEAFDGSDGWDKLQTGDYDAAMIDMDMPRMTGPEVLARVRADARFRHLRILMMSGRFSTDEMAQTLHAGADDFLTKPFSVVQLRARIGTGLRLKQALDHSEVLMTHLQTVSADLERSLLARDHDLGQVRSALVLGLAAAVGHRTTETGSHLIRMQKYAKYLAEEAGALPAFRQIDAAFLHSLECCSPLHDLGIVALPDHILMKPGKLDVDERMIMQAHTHIGAQILERVVETYGTSVAFLQTGIDMCRSHHEHYSGNGYPDRLVGDDIPLAARILAIGDVYDALRSRRSYRPALSHNSAVQVVCEGSAGQFDPNLLAVFRKGAGHFDKVFSQNPD